MLEINKQKFDVKSAEINFRQRNYNEKSYITVNITTDFFPSIVNDQVVYGNIDLKIDLEGIKSIENLVNKEYNGEIGTINISVNNDGIWESNNIENFKVVFTNREDKYLSFKISAKDFEYEDKARMISLNTTSTSEEDLQTKFDLKDFHLRAIKREVGKSVISKYFIK